MKELAPGIAVFDNVFMDAIKYVNLIEANCLKWNPAKVVVKLNDSKSQTKHESRDTDVIMLGKDLASSSIESQLAKEFHNNTKTLINQYAEFYGARFESFESPQLLRYGPEQMFRKHVDDSPLSTRRISLTFYINEDYEGGEVIFDKFNLRFQAKPNQLLVFPSNFMYSHEVKPVKSGLRYVIVQWIA